MPRARVSASLIPVQGGGIKKTGLQPTVGTSYVLRLACKKCIKQRT